MRQSLSADIIETTVNFEVATAVSGAGNRIQQAMHATRFTGAYDRDGAPIMEPDHPLALEAIKTAGELVGRVREKSGGSAINIGINNQPGGGNGTGQIKTFEQRVREKRGVLSAGDVKFLSDGQANEIVDDSDSDSDDDELADELADGTSDAEIEDADGAERSMP
jgi:hypothetical protein